MIWIVGANGQLGRELTQLLEPQQRVESDLECDICNYSEVKSFAKERCSSIKTIINCAAYTAVEKAEEPGERERVFAINVRGAANLAQVAAELDANLIHISTDYVFSGEKNTPYQESDRAHPLSFYGQSKWESELAVLNVAGGRGVVIIRTAWLFSSYGNNFVKTILRCGREGRPLNVVFDQIGCPTYAEDLARAILTIAKTKNSEKLYGNEIYHYSNEGVASWYDFAKAILELSEIKSEIRPVLSKEYPSKVVRPIYSVLDKSKIKKDFNISIPYWRESLARCIEKIKIQEQTQMQMQTPAH